MKKIIIGTAVLAAGLVALRRFGPAIREQGMNKCHQMMSKCQEMFAQQATSPANKACMSADTPGPGQATAGEPERAEAARAA